MPTVLLVRHGETTWNRHRRVQGWAPSRLTDRGRRQAEAAGRAIAADFDVERIHASDLRRSRETAELMADALDAPVELDAGWRERDFGAYQGLPYDRLFERFPALSVTRSGAEALEHRPEGGESYREMRERVFAAWDRVTDADGGTRLVVTHGGPLYAVLGHLKGLDAVASITDVEVDNCAINEVRLDGSGAELVRENDSDW